MIFENRLNRALMSIFRTPQCTNCGPSTRNKVNANKSERDAINRVKVHILRGDSMLKKPLKSGHISIDDIIYSIKNNRCLRAKERDIGSTNVETIVSTSISEIFKANQVNQVRKIFGLETKED